MLLLTNISESSSIHKWPSESVSKPNVNKYSTAITVACVRWLRCFHQINYVQIVCKHDHWCIFNCNCNDITAHKNDYWPEGNFYWFLSHTRHFAYVTQVLLAGNLNIKNSNHNFNWTHKWTHCKPVWQWFFFFFFSFWFLNNFATTFIFKLLLEIVSHFYRESMGRKGLTIANLFQRLQFQQNLTLTYAHAMNKMHIWFVSIQSNK